MTWSHNTADGNGGAVDVRESSGVSWSGETVWSHNTADYGGAVYVSESTDVSWSGETAWSHNTAGVNGGAVYVSESTNVSWSGETIWSYNAAGFDGGAFIAISSTVIMLELSLFEGNTAASDGGAIMLSGGSAVLTGGYFVGNSAYVGLAILNVGVLAMEGSAYSFSGNSLFCKIGTYLNSIAADGTRYSLVCNGCPGKAPGYGVENEDSVPSCEVQPEHTRSQGGNTTIETLNVDPGYWRTTNTSLNFLACFNEDACKGGMTDDPAFCQPGYEGPCK